MAIKATLSQDDFVTQFRTARGTEEFSIPALRALYDWYEAYSDSVGEDIEFDPVAIGCAWSEYYDIKEVRNNYGLDDDVDSLSAAHVQFQRESINSILVNRYGIIPAGRHQAVGDLSCLKNSLLIHEH